jgi:hypothetical protein
VRVGTGRCLVALTASPRPRRSSPPSKTGSPLEGRQAFQLAKLKAGRGSVDGLEGRRGSASPGSALGESRRCWRSRTSTRRTPRPDALPYYRRMLAEYPAGQYADPRPWRSRGVTSARAGSTPRPGARARRRAVSHHELHARLPVLAGRARAASLGQTDRARQLPRRRVRVASTSATTACAPRNGCRAAAP